jgi:AcrR family transcriptional regulator
MPNNRPSIVRKSAAEDPRVVRTTRALNAALVELMTERDFSEISVQSILKRSGVGRATLYAHYRNKRDILHASYEGFFESLESVLDSPARRRGRVAPVAELLEHIRDMGPALDGLKRSGEFEELWGMGGLYLARIIERRIVPATRESPVVPKSLVARMLGGAVMEMAEWWLGGRSGTSGRSAVEMDGVFHDLARATLRQASYMVAG